MVNYGNEVLLLEIVILQDLMALHFLFFENGGRFYVYCAWLRMYFRLSFRSAKT